jgi:hypothetical protein
VKIAALLHQSLNGTKKIDELTAAIIGPFEMEALGFIN